MKYKFFFLFIFILGCTNTYNQVNKSSFYSEGFAYIFEDIDYNNKVVAKKFDNNKFVISHNSLKNGMILKITNPENQDSIILKNSKKSSYPDFYELLITRAVAKKINLDFSSPFVEIQEIKKNKSFIAEKAKTFNEEKKIHSKAPVEVVKIDNISKKTNKKIKKNKKYVIIIGEFYSLNSINLLKNKLIKELPEFNHKKLYTKAITANKIKLLSGPYNSINSLKNDYIAIKNYGFEDLNLKIYD